MDLFYFGDSFSINIHFIQGPEELDPPWVTANKNSVGELWVNLFRYFTCKFKVSTNIINIRFSKPLVRSEYGGSKFGGRKLAIEGIDIYLFFLRVLYCIPTGNNAI